MTIDKRITYRRNFKGGADASMADFGAVTTPGVSKGRTGPGPNVSAGGASFNDLGPGPSGRQYRESREEFIKNVQKTNPGYTGNPSRDSFLKKAISGGIGFAKKNPLQILLSAINPVFGAAIFGANILNQPKFRKRFTGYETQQEYDDARQQRIDLNRIDTIQNTLDTKYADGDYSMTDLDERLASLQEGLGITPNTAAQNAQQFLNFSNQPELSYEGIKSLAQPAINLNDFKGLPTTAFIDRTNLNDYPQTQFGDNPNKDIISPVFTGDNNFQDIENFVSDAKTDNRTLLEKLLNPDLDVDEAIDREEEKRKREQELLQEIMKT